MESWSWRGCAGNKAEVEVYARGAEVELLMNGNRVGRKKLKKSCNTTFRTTYQDGEITAIAYDAWGNEISRTSLQTAGKETKLTIRPELPTIKKNGLGFIQLQYTDTNGIWKPMEKHNLQVSVKGGELLGLGSACSYNPDGYQKNTVKTYYGEALAIVKANSSGPVEVIVKDETGSHTIEIPCIN
jgi:beta-galactosidase